MENPDVKMILSAFPEITRNILPRAEKIVLTIADLAHIELVGVALQIGRALNDPSQGRYIIRRVEVRLAPRLFRKVRTLQKAARMPEAQEIILAELERNFL